MRFSGHETFHLRDGWLHKGLNLLFHEPTALVGSSAADKLGVGQNMAKSIRHWLQVTGLAQWGDRKIEGPRVMKPTSLGELVHERDPYFLEPGTLWALHTNLVSGAEAGSWYWFFNYFNLTRFEREVCLENLRQFLQVQRVKQPSRTTLERDLQCMLASYSQPIPPRHEDPEEEPYCPLVDLDLLRHYRSSGHYEINREPKQVPFELVGYSLAVAFSDVAQGKGRVDIRLEEAQRQPGAPGRVFALSPETLFDTLLAAESECEGEKIQISGLAGERAVRVVCQSTCQWLADHYTRMEHEEENVA
jgi:hypothetical protein